MHLRFRTISSNSNNFITITNQPLKRMQKQGSENGFIVSMLKITFGKGFNVFNVFVDTAGSFIKLLSLH